MKSGAVWWRENSFLEFTISLKTVLESHDAVVAMPGRSLRFAPSLTSRLEPKFILFRLKEFSQHSRELGSKVVSNREAQDSGRFRFQSAQGAQEVYTMCVRGGPYLTKII